MSVGRPLIAEHFISHGRRRGRPKRSFPTERAAVVFADRVHGLEGTRIYQCSFCGAWHISAPKERRR